MALFALPAVFAGCGGQVDREQSSAQKSTAELSLAEQAAAVREGAGDRIQVETAPLTDKDLAALSGLEKLRELLIDNSHSQFTAAGIRQLTDLPNLEHLRIRGRGVDDEGLAHLAEFPSLKILNVPQGNFTDEGLAHLKKLPELVQLRFGSPRVSDAGMATLAELPSLKRLHLIDVPITDAGLRRLAEIEQLQSLYLDGANLSDEAYDELFRRRPKLHVHINQQHHDRDPHQHPHAP